MVRVTLQEQSDLIRRKLEAGCRVPPPEVLMNNGSRRTPEKRELLRSIRELAAAQGRDPLFKAKF